jgi:hypothetical protein
MNDPITLGAKTLYGKLAFIDSFFPNMLFKTDLANSTPPSTLIGEELCVGYIIPAHSTFYQIGAVGLEHSCHLSVIRAMFCFDIFLFHCD